jgi:hypothetical protein
VRDRDKTSPPPLPRSCLSALVGADSAAQFPVETWRRRTFHGVGCVDAELRRALELNVHSFKQSAHGLDSGSLRAYTRTPNGAAQEIVIRQEQIDELFWTGMTISAIGFQKVHLPVAAALRALRDELGFGGIISATVFFSPPHSGYGLHFDDLDVFNIQLQGTKAWRFGTSPAITDPPFPAKAEDVASVRESSPWLRPKAPVSRMLRRTTLSPGDVLYLPAGTWHEAEAHDVSLSMSFNFQPVSRARLLADRLVAALSHYEEWRAPSTSARKRASQPSLDTVDALARRMEEQLRLEEDSTSPTHDGGPAPPPPPVGRRDKLRVVHPFRVRAAKGMSDDLDVVTSVRGFSLGIETHPLLARLGTTDTLVAGDVLRWPPEERLGNSWPEVRDLLAQLIELGLLAPATNGRSRSAPPNRARHRRRPV